MKYHIDAVSTHPAYLLDREKDESIVDKLIQKN